MKYKEKLLIVLSFACKGYGEFFPRRHEIGVTAHCAKSILGSTQDTLSQGIQMLNFGKKKNLKEGIDERLVLSLDVTI